MIRSILTTTSLVLCGVSVTACAQHRPVDQGPVASPEILSSDQAADRQVLAGEWEYEDGAVVTLRLDEQGNGSYNWKNGQFVTTGIHDRTWVGIWSQSENDCEGGFEVTLSPDYTEGEGRWWYTRIGSNESPGEKGGRFHLTRVIVNAERTGDPAP